MFVNEAGHDYHLQAGSPAIDAGSSNLAPSTDFAGTPRPQGSGYDIGAYEYTAGGSGGGGGGGGGGTTTDKLSLFLSEDAYKGNANFVAKIDGQQVGSGSVSALHSSGNTQNFSYTGSWGTGLHNLEIDFTNDLYGGSPTADRNLYVNGISYDGSSALPSGSFLTMLSNGAVHFAIGHS